MTNAKLLSIDPLCKNVSLKNFRRDVDGLELGGLRSETPCIIWLLLHIHLYIAAELFNTAIMGTS